MARSTELEAAHNPMSWASEQDIGFFTGLEDSFQFPHDMIRHATPGYLDDISYPIPLSMTTRDTMRSLEPRAQSKPSAKMSALFLNRIIGSYPAMMVRKETFPPFIHPHTSSGDGAHLPEPLLNCTRLAQMFVNRSKETSKFVWRTIKMEQERLWNDVKY